MGDTSYILGLWAMSFGIICGVASVQSYHPVTWGETLIFLFVGSLLLARARRYQMRRGDRTAK